MKLEGSHIQKIRQPDYKHLLLDIYRPGGREKLLISLDQGRTRIHFQTTPVVNQLKLQRFAQLLRSRINGGRIVSCRQPGGQRIIRIEVRKGDEVTLLWVRLWNNSPNIIATDEEGVILDCFMRRPNRNELSGAHYSPDLSAESPDPKFELRPLEGEGSYGERIEHLYSRSTADEELTKLRRQAAALAEKLDRHLRDRIGALGENLERAQNSGIFKQKADLIMNNSHQIQRGMDSFTTENWYDENRPIKIELDSRRTAMENGELYYKKYKKAKASTGRVSEELANTQANLDSLETDQLWIAETGDAGALKQWIDARKRSVPVQSDKGKSIPGLQFTSNGFTLLVGRTAKENDELLRRHVRGNDTWLHTRDYPGGYIFIRTIPGKSIPLETLLDAGNLAVHYSKAKTGGEADLYYTRVKYLRRAKNGPVGLVLPTQEKNLHVKVEQQRITRLTGK